MSRAGRAFLAAGVCGPIGSGKSAVCARLAALGASLIDADRIGRALLEPGTRVHGRVVRAFGRGILDGMGGVDRAALAAIVFTDARALRRLNAISGPEIAAEIRRRLDHLAASGFDGMAVVDAALLRDWDPRRFVDCLVLVEAPAALRRERTVSSGRLTGEEFERRDRAQARPAGRVPSPDVILYNDGGLEDLERKAAALWEHLQRLRNLSSRSTAVRTRKKKEER